MTGSEVDGIGKGLRTGTQAQKAQTQLRYMLGAHEAIVANYLCFFLFLNIFGWG